MMRNLSKEFPDIHSYFHSLNSLPDLDPLMKRTKNAKFALLGEASHGTHEYYTWRAQISKRLITEQDFTFIAVEGDWPACYEINQWVKGMDPQKNVEEVLGEFTRWPTWMWANWETAAFLTWLREYNKDKPSDKKVGFYGLDIYSLWESLAVMLEYLEKEDPEAATLAREAFQCFEPYRATDSYTSVFRYKNKDCRNEVLSLLQEVRAKAHQYDSQLEAGLNTEINALVMANAENYYKAMAVLGDTSWNVRDRHMMEALQTILKYHSSKAKAIVWAHNTHIGDARYTNMEDEGLINIGQLTRQKYGEENVVLVGAGSYRGSVMAGQSWGAPMQRMEVPPAVQGSIENELHTHFGKNGMFIFNENPNLAKTFKKTTGHRAIGVVYRPTNERGNYVPTSLSRRYDAFLYFDTTKAVHPIPLQTKEQKIPDTFPFGI